jgi:hypothetical protein
MWIAVLWILSVIAAFICGALVYRNNAKRFKALEERAKAAGKSLEELI